MKPQKTNDLNFLESVFLTDFQSGEQQIVEIKQGDSGLEIYTAGNGSAWKHIVKTEEINPDDLAALLPKEKLKMWLENEGVDVEGFLAKCQKMVDEALSENDQGEARRQ